VEIGKDDAVNRDSLPNGVRVRPLGPGQKECEIGQELHDKREDNEIRGAVIHQDSWVSCFIQTDFTTAVSR
jgi:hypothetical protein